MLHWNDLHPYNAVHVVQLPGPLDVARLRNRIQHTLAARGLTHLSLDRTKGAYRYEGGPTNWEIRILAGGDDPRLTLFAEVERQLNTAFALGERINPFRFFVTTAVDSFFLGLVYFHATADAESVVLLLKELVKAWSEVGTSAVPMPLDLYPDGRVRWWRRSPGVVARRLLSLPRQIRNLRRSCRTTCRDAADLVNRFVGFSLDVALLRGVVATAKSWQVTVNDLWLALLLNSLSPLSAGRAQTRKRRAISVGCIVNVRQALGMERGQAFGLFLGSFTVTHEVPDGIGLSQLARDIQHQTSAIKRQQLSLGTPMELGFARFLFNRCSPRGRLKFYPKHYPLWGGVTNLNLDPLWKAEPKVGPLDYFRGVSTGPATPLVVSVTTFGDHANIGLSYRSAVFTPAAIEGLKGRFLKELAQMKEGV